MCVYGSYITYLCLIFHVSSADHDVHACEISPEGDMAAAGLANGQVVVSQIIYLVVKSITWARFLFQMFELQSGAVTYKLTAPFMGKLPATAVRFRQPKVPIDTWLQNILLVACKYYLL